MVPALHQNIFEALSRRGFAIAPAAYFSNEPTSDVSAQEPNTNPLANEFWVLEDGQLFAKLNFNQNAVEATSELRITGPEGDFLAEAKSTVLPCSGGWCRETKLTTARDSASDSVDGAQGLIISQEPSYGMKYYVYGERVGVTSWRYQFDDRYEWILAVLSDKSQAMPIQAFTDMQRFVVALASRPAVIPFLDVIQVQVARDGHLIVRGRVTHAAYNGIIDAALDSGFYNIQPLLVGTPGTNQNTGVEIGGLQPIVPSLDSNIVSPIAPVTPIQPVQPVQPAVTQPSTTQQPGNQQPITNQHPGQHPQPMFPMDMGQQQQIHYPHINNWPAHGGGGGGFVVCGG